MNMKKTAGLLQAQGRNGDTILAHINPHEAKMLKEAGGSGTINPETGLMEFGWWTSIRDAFQTVAVVVGNYFLPGSSIVTSKIASKGSQEQLGSTLGQVATMAAGIYGGAEGNLGNYGKVLNSMGLNSVTNGITNAADWLDESVNGMFSSGTAAGNVSGNVPGKVAETAASKAAQQAGIAPNASDFLNTGAQKSTDSIINNALQQQTTSTPTFGMNEVAGYNRVAANIPPQPQPGLIGRIGEWASDNPVPALMAGQAVMSGIGGMSQAQAQAEQAALNRDLSLQLHTVQGGFGTPARGIVANDPNLVTDMAGRYIRGPLAGQYAPGRAPGLLNARRV